MPLKFINESMEKRKEKCLILGRYEELLEKSGSEP